MTEQEKLRRSELNKLVAANGRYTRAAYEFVLEAVNVITRKKISDGQSGADLHISGQFLAEGMKAMLLAKYGCMASNVLQHWNVKTTNDFGVLVFELVHAGLLGANENDDISDFDNLFSFDEAFIQPYLPNGKPMQLPLLQ